MSQTQPYETPGLLSSEAISLLLSEIEHRASSNQAQSAPTDWRDRVRAMFGPYFVHPFSPPHEELWEWAAALKLGHPARPFVAIWPRGRGKSTHAEATVADLAARSQRSYIMYVSGTQDQADKHVQTIARMLERDAVAQYYPNVGKPLVGKNGSRTWNRTIITTATRVTVEAVGLNKAVRGQKIDWARPDLIVFDDVDEKHDTERATAKKIDIITGSILPAGSDDCAILFVQNLIHRDSIAAMLATPADQPGAATFLMDRVVSGPFPAVRGLAYEARQAGDAIRWHITAGDPLWQGFGLSVCEDEINRMGPSAYEVESQHNVDADNPDALLTAEHFDATRVFEHPPLHRVAVSVDPPASSGQCGIMVGGWGIVNGRRHGYTLADRTPEPGVRPEEWALEVLKAYHEFGADVVIVEVNNGGDMVESVIRGVKYEVDGRALVDGRHVPIMQVRASRGKIVRAEPVSVLFEQGVAHHLGYLPEAEKQWRTYRPGDASPDRLDAEVWLYTGLELTAGSQSVVRHRAPARRGGQHQHTGGRSYERAKR